MELANVGALNRGFILKYSNYYFGIHFIGLHLGLLGQLKDTRCTEGIEWIFCMLQHHSQRKLSSGYQSHGTSCFRDS